MNTAKKRKKSQRHEKGSNGSNAKEKKQVSTFGHYFLAGRVFSFTHLSQRHRGSDLPLFDELDELLALESEPNVRSLLQQPRALSRDAKDKKGDGALGGTATTFGCPVRRIKTRELCFSFPS